MYRIRAFLFDILWLIVSGGNVEASRASATGEFVHIIKIPDFYSHVF